MIRFCKGTLEKLYEEGCQSYPEECCGILLGVRTDAGERWVKEIRPQENTASEEERIIRYSISFQKLMEEEVYAAEKGYEVVGFYHSHPDLAAEASEVDKYFFIPELSYPILAVYAGRVKEIRSYVKYYDGRNFVFCEEEIEKEV